jgi:hypothetical protein
VDTLGYFAQQTGSDGFVGRVLAEVDGDEELLGFGVDVSYVDTTFVVEQNPVTLLQP